MQLQSDDSSENGRVVVYNSFEKFKAVKVSLTSKPTESLKVKDLLKATSSSQSQLTFKKDQYTSQSLLILHDDVNLKGVTPYAQYIFSSKNSKDTKTTTDELINLSAGGVNSYSASSLTDLISKIDIV